MTCSLSSADISIFHGKSAISLEIEKNCVLIHSFNSFDFFGVLKCCLEKHNCNDDFRKIDYSRPYCDIANNVLSHESNCVVDVVI